MVTITSIAEEKIKELILEEENAVGLRIYVKGGGCSGYQYGGLKEINSSSII